MKLALIPPIELLDLTFQTNYQLMLPQLVDYEEYANTYRMHCADPKTYVILDNGAAEGYTPTDIELIQIANRFRVDEIVLPDVLTEMDETLQRSRAYLDFMGTVSTIQKFNTMFVCQGKDLFEFVESATEASRWPEVTAIGIPRHAIVTCDNELARSSIANILQTSERFTKQIHFLGASSAFPSEAAILSDPKRTVQRNVRGMDTSMPFNYAFKGLDLRDGIVVDRASDYFDLRKKEFDDLVVNRQISTYKIWTRSERE